MPKITSNVTFSDGAHMQAIEGFQAKKIEGGMLIYMWADEKGRTTSTLSFPIHRIKDEFTEFEWADDE